MSQLFPTEDDPKRPPAPWEASPFDDDFDAAYAEEISSGARETEETRETEEQPFSPQPPNEEGEVGFPWQSGSPNQRTASSAPLPWENQDSSRQSYRTQATPQNPVRPASPPRPNPPKNSLQPKKLTSDLWQNINIPPWVLAAAATVAVLGIGVMWTANSLPKDPTTGAEPNIAAGKNSPVGAGGGPSSTSVPVRPLRSRVSPGSSPKGAAQPGYVPEATPSRPTDPSSENKNVNPSDSTLSAETSAESSEKSPYLSSLEASSTATGEGPIDPFSPAYPAPKPPPEPKPAVVPKPQPLPPPPKVPPPVLSLEGVAVEGKTKLAIVRVGDQPLTAEAQVGATIEGWTVIAISDEAVTLTKGKQRQVLRLP